MRRGEVRIVCLQHADRHSKHRRDFFDDIISTRDILAWKRQRHKLNVTADRDHASALACALMQRPHRLLEPPHRLFACSTFYYGCIVWSAHVLQETQVLCMGCLRLLDRCVRRLDLAEPVVQVSWVGSLEVNDLVQLEPLHRLRVRAIEIRLDKFSLAWHDRHMLRRHRIQLAWNAEPLVGDHM